MSYLWEGSAACEGGPVLIADVEDFASWGGADQRWAEDSVYRVHYYGPLIRRLPARFQPQGVDEWHQDRCIATRAAAQAYVDELAAAARSLEPGLASREQKPMTPDELESKVRAFGSSDTSREEWLRSWRDHMEQGLDFSVGDERVLHVDVKPDTDYARGCDALRGPAARISFGSGSGKTGALWDLEGAGIADVAVAKSRDALLLLRTWVNREEDEAVARAHAESAAEKNNVAEVAFGTGRVVVVWSTMAAEDVGRKPDPVAWLRRHARPGPPFNSMRPASRAWERSSISGRGSTGSSAEGTRRMTGAAAGPGSHEFPSLSARELDA